MCHSQNWKRRSLFLAAATACPLTPPPPGPTNRQKSSRPFFILSLERYLCKKLSCRSVFSQQQWCVIPRIGRSRRSLFLALAACPPPPSPPALTNSQKSIVFLDCIFYFWLGFVFARSSHVDQFSLSSQQSCVIPRIRRGSLFGLQQQ